ncbi:MAG: hypothetical protein Q8M03_04845 [Legionella sp.]|nr:hypothetical protein [Legionella sp.]
MKKIAVITLLMVGLGSCTQYAGNGDNKYLSSRNSANLVVPSPLTSSNVSHFYDLPRQDKNAVVNIAPPSQPVNDR